MLVFLCVVSLLRLASGATVPDQEEELFQNSCLMGWYDFNGRCYKYVASPVVWANAESYCVSEGANLASVHSESEQMFISTLIKSFDPAERPTWIGLSDVHMEGRWMWSDGSEVDFAIWYGGQPNGGVTENCVTTHFSGPKWFDRDCNSNLYSFVCAKRLCK
ncbi:galactose-specific lectin nattectin-like [Oncorhynchus nerka]|uniref:galactose-specific lectin nattectin-like n=1 Tax=Oncorhynchus nerka TaxID=8023 RepID=UPI0031B7F5E4